ncbi:peptidase family M28 [Seiridium cupressi]
MIRSIFYATAALAISAAALPLEAREELFTIELAPGVTRQVTESKKYELKAQGVRFFDITETGPNAAEIEIAAVTYPTAVQQTAAVNALIPSLVQDNLETTLTTFSTFQNRYYKSTYGQQSSAWLLKQVQAVIAAANVTAAVKAEPFTHTWGQSSIIATIPGQTENIVILGAHQDSINQRSPQNGRAPGADDDGSATVELLEAFRVLLTDAKVAAGQAVNTIEFHWYSAEEGGLLGSQAIFNSYKSAGKVVKGMLNQDETGYVAPGTTESIGLFSDYTDAALTAFIGKVIKAYTKLPAVSTKCGYACSDHASARNAGYPVALISESAFDDTSPYTHSAQDTLDTVNFAHLLELTKVSLGVAYELGFATL